MIYLPAEEKDRIGALVQHLVRQNVRKCGHYPLGISIRLVEDQQELNFTLRRREGRLVYEAAELVEMDGVPNQTLRVSLKEGS